MRFKNDEAEIFIPDGMPEEQALKRTTHMGISAHHDDLEIMAYDGILKCFGSDSNWFLGVVVTDGRGSPRVGLYRDYTDEQMMKVRKHEQKKAAFVGEYGAVVMLHYKSSEAKDAEGRNIIDELKKLIISARPRIIYTHNPADKHDTHVGVAVKVIKALRELPPEYLPEHVYGCEVWRGLDWMSPEDRVMFHVAARPNIASALLEVFDSQICGGKRYDLATIGRRLGNATYAESHVTDESNSIIYAMDLTPLVMDERLDIKEYVLGYIARFSKDVANRLGKML